jgi:hypothetical protein
MSGPSKVVVLDPDPRAARQLQLGFEREGVPAVLAPVPIDGAKLELADKDPALVLVGGHDGRAVELVQKARAWLGELFADVPVVFAGGGAARDQLEQAGADEVVLRPSYLRDVVTIGRILRGVPATQRGHLVGSLVETTGVYTLVRALAALGRSAVLTLVRGLRRGEIRFYRGEVTSAQVGLIHGQAALHQLLLWTDARFDFHHEIIVRRQQIPLTPDELFGDAERFLQGVRDSAGQLSPSMVLEQDVMRVQEVSKQIPTEVHGVLRMFDGHRVLADVLEDSPYRVFETLRVAGKAVEAGLLRAVDAQRPKSTWRAVLAIEEWLTGNESRDAIVERTSQFDSGPVSGPIGGPKKKKRRKKKRAPTPPPTAEVKAEIDWGALVPRTVGAEVGPLSGVVPAVGAAGEIVVTASRESRREGLEALMDTDKRTRIFPTDVGVEPSVVWNEQADNEHAERERLEREAKAQAAAAAAAAAAEAQAKAQAIVDEDAARKARQDAARKEAEESVARVKAAMEKRERDERAEADARAKAIADEDARALADATQPTAKQPEPELEARPARDSDVTLPVVKQDVDDTATTDPVVKQARAETPPPASSDDIITTPIPKLESATATTDPNMLVKQLVAEALTVDHTSARVKVALPMTIAETPAATVTVADTVTVVGAAGVAVVTATPTVTVREAAAVARAPSAAPIATEDEPSDGIVRAMIATADTAKNAARARRAPSSPPESDGPPEKSAKGEIRERPKRKTSEPAMPAEPSILVSDLAAAHAAATAAMAAPTAPQADVATPSRELVVAETRKDAVAFTDVEEAFFKAGSAGGSGPIPLQPAAHVESFDDLDEGYQPPKFWDRVFGRRGTRPPTQPPIDAPRRRPPTDNPAPPKRTPSKRAPTKKR